MLALTLTCRPQWRPWLDHQLAKQEFMHTLIVFDDSSTAQMWPTGSVVIRTNDRLKLSLGEKRQLVLLAAESYDEPFAWFDDDDWHPRHRLRIGSKLIKSAAVDAVGYHTGVFCDVKSLQTRRLDTGDRLCFNGAVYAAHCAKARFQPLNRGEDTAWNRSALASATIVSSPDMEHAWISGDWNVTGRRGTMSYEGPRFSKFDSWEKKFLEGVRW